MKKTPARCPNCAVGMAEWTVGDTTVYSCRSIHWRGDWQFKCKPKEQEHERTERGQGDEG